LPNALGGNRKEQTSTKESNSRIAAKSWKKKKWSPQICFIEKGKERKRFVSRTSQDAVLHVVKAKEAAANVVARIREK
jgi:hypothetical protein